MLREGDWEGERLLGRDAVRQTTGSSGLPGARRHGLVDQRRTARCPELPADAFWGAGAGGQVLLVVPSLKLIVVRNGGEPRRPGQRRAINRYLFAPLMGVFPGKGPAGRRRAAAQPRDPGIAWAPKETIVRRGQGQRQLAADLGRRRRAVRRPTATGTGSSRSRRRS